MPTIIKELQPHEEAALLPAHPILVAYRGSIAHGTHVPPTAGGIDDVDIQAVFIPPGLDYYFGLRGAERGKDIKINEWDCAAYELIHYVRLAAGANPNVLSLLWTNDKHVIYSTIIGRELQRHRHLFATKKAAKSFGGYAVSQLKRMTAFHEELDLGCKCEGDFHAPDCPLTQERGRGSQKKFATGYMGAKRKALVEKHGYDTKNAAHLVRLLRMGIEFLQTGDIIVDRREAGDSNELIGIKTGNWKLEEVKKLSEDLFVRLGEAEAASTLRADVDLGQVNKLLTHLLSRERVHDVILAAKHANSHDFMAKYGNDPLR
jgi:hypothetical protein